MDQNFFAANFKKASINTTHSIVYSQSPQDSSNFVNGLISTAAAPRIGSLNAKFMYKATSLINNFCMEK